MVKLIKYICIYYVYRVLISRRKTYCSNFKGKNYRTYTKKIHSSGGDSDGIPTNSSKSSSQYSLSAY